MNLNFSYCIKLKIQFFKLLIFFTRLVDSYLRKREHGTKTTNLQEISNSSNVKQI